MALRVKVEGVPAFQRALADLGGRMSRATPNAIDENLRTVVRQQHTLLTLATHPRGTPTGSPPGSPPWRISGDLADSVRADPARELGAGRWGGQAGPTAIYGRIQELGGDTGYRHQTHLPPRPSLYPAWRIARPTMRDVFIRHWAQAQRV